MVILADVVMVISSSAFKARVKILKYEHGVGQGVGSSELKREIFGVCPRSRLLRRLCHL